LCVDILCKEWKNKRLPFWIVISRDWRW
jgi:hypothetical protein